VSQRRLRYSEFCERIDVDAFEEAIGWAPESQQGDNDVGFCLWPENHKNGDTTGKFGIHREKRIYNCVSGDTWVQTRGGLFKARDLEGHTVDVLTEGGEYRPAKWNHFGEDLTYRVVFENGDEIVCTLSHRWRVSRIKGEPWSKDRRAWVTTKDLLGRSVPMQASQSFKYDDIDDYRNGVRHGLVYGDGTLYMEGKYTKLPAFGDEDRALVREFCSDISEYNYGGVEQTQARKLPGHYKALPKLKESSSYRRGFIAGLLAADGHVNSNSNVVIHQADFEELNQIRLIAASVGIPSSSIKIDREFSPFTGECAPLWKLNILRAGMMNEGKPDHRLILKPSHRANAAQWSERMNTHTVKVVGVHELIRGPVYCCTEPETSTWVFGFGYLTGNCYVCGGGSFLSLAMEALDLDVEQATKFLFGLCGDDLRDDNEFVDDFLESFKDVNKRVETLPYFNDRVLEKYDTDVPVDVLGKWNISSIAAEDYGVRYSDSVYRKAPSRSKFEGEEYSGPGIVARRGLPRVDSKVHNDYRLSKGINPVGIRSGP
jgi:hypothetical protein